MSAQIPTSEPFEIIIGETVKWSISDPDYSPADGWALKEYLRGPGSGLNLTEADCIAVDGSAWLITIPAHDTGDPLPPATDQLGAGDYYWERWVEKGAEKYRRASGKTIVKQSLASVATNSTYDGRSEVKQTLDAIRAAIARVATQAQLERTIAGTTIRFMSIDDLEKAEAKYVRLYNRELRKGRPPFRTISTRFVSS